MASTIALNGTETALASPEGRDFVSDCVRAGEGLISDSDLREKYEIAADAWKNITKNKALVQAIRTESERRTRTGIAAKEAASKHFAKAPGYLNEIMSDKATSPKYRIEASKELRATATGDGNSASSNADKFVINITLGGGRGIHREFDLPMKQIRSTSEEWGWDEVHHE
jgi:hypothetical protein